MDDPTGGGAAAPAPDPPPPAAGEGAAAAPACAGKPAAPSAKGGCGESAAPPVVAGTCDDPKPAADAAAPTAEEEEKDALIKNYSRMYNVPDGDMSRALKLGYSERFFKILPNSLMKSFYGSACPWNLGDPAEGSTVLDFGSGLGVDCYIAAKLGAGRAYGIDLTPKAVEDATAKMKELGMSDKISFHVGDIEDETLPGKLGLEGKIDLVSSNGVINLVDVKQKVFNTAFAFLKSGGLMRFSDMAMETPLPPSFF